jgi:hypothetical protein
MPDREGRLRLRSLGRLVADKSVSPVDAAFNLGVLPIDRVVDGGATRSPGRPTLVPSGGDVNRSSADTVRLSFRADQHLVWPRSALAVAAHW